MFADLQQAIKNSLQTEKNAMDFYLAGSRFMKDQAAKQAFELLAREEREHAGHFFKIYKGSDIPSLDAFLDTPVDMGAGWLASLGKVIDAGFTEKDALEIALEKERRLEETLQETAAKIDDPDVKAVYELNARETHNHYAMIESEYARIMGMVHETDIDTFVRE